VFNVATRGVGGSAAVDYGNQLRKIVTEIFCRKRIGEVWTRRRGFDIETTVFVRRSSCCCCCCMYHNLCKLKSQWQSVCCSRACSFSFVVQEDAEVGGVMMRREGNWKEERV
jgi:hypothetical protein